MFDARYLLLTSKERKSTFDEFCRERISDEKREKRLQLDQIRENFRKLLIDAKVHIRYFLLSFLSYPAILLWKQYFDFIYFSTNNVRLRYYLLYCIKQLPSLSCSD